jgi:hypothetical protein
MHHLKLTKLMGWGQGKLHSSSKLVEGAAGGALSLLLTSCWGKHQFEAQ